MQCPHTLLLIPLRPRNPPLRRRQPPKLLTKRCGVVGTEGLALELREVASAAVDGQELDGVVPAREALVPGADKAPDLRLALAPGQNLEDGLEVGRVERAAAAADRRLVLLVGGGGGGRGKGVGAVDDGLLVVFGAVERLLMLFGADERPLMLLAGVDELALGMADRPLMVIFGVEELMFDVVVVVVVVDSLLTLLAGVEDCWSRFSSEDMTSADIPIIPLTGAEEGGGFGDEGGAVIESPLTLLAGTEDPGFGDEEEEDDDGVAVIESPLTLLSGAELDTPTPEPLGKLFPPLRT
ncbi:hypothetical protein VMCG_03831 [Cytospora schulzeri]|uniref:Uncharacterized protein n=1 Tax=Cytospora schulzeri TaxID=448051 RepID=A0A423WVG8_9PEZI|nr:hypothetical protein VMCG_03831 [Valsa malicola]